MGKREIIRRNESWKEHKEIKRASLPTSITAKMIATTPVAISTVLTLSSRRERQPYSRKVE